jgi:hypothetical protein
MEKLSIVFLAKALLHLQLCKEIEAVNIHK